MRYITSQPGGVVHDIGVSSGVTSCDFYDLITSAEEVMFFISDKYTRYYCAGSYIVRIYDVNKTFLYGYLLWLVAKKREGWRYIISTLLYWIIRESFPADQRFHEICLFDTQARQYLTEGKLRNIEYDVFETELLNRFTFVRCMNVLNRDSWFSDESISVALSLISKSIVEGGVLQVGRSRDNGLHDVSFFKKSGTNLILVENVGQGTELIDLIEATNGGNEPIITQ
jgi:hypothetical protein